VHYAAWIARRWDDPSFPPTFPHFGSEEYWQNETRDLEEQQTRIESADAEAAGVAGAAPELTNKDFFWDL
jgi:hypothetical protein